MNELRIPHAGLGRMHLPSIHEQLALPRHVGPDQDDLVFFSATIHRGHSGRNGGGGGEAELEGDATLGGGDGLSRAFGAEVDLVGGVARKVEPGSVHAEGSHWRHVCPDDSGEKIINNLLKGRTEAPHQWRR